MAKTLRCPKCVKYVPVRHLGGKKPKVMGVWHYKCSVCGEEFISSLHPDCIDGPVA